MSFANNAPICRRCLDARGVTCNGACPCPADADKRDILEHINSGVCPLNYFSSPPEPPSPPSIPLAGDLLASAISHFGESRLVKLVKRVLGPECGCAERQAKLNRLDAAIRKKLTRYP